MANAEPTVEDFITIAKDAVRGQKDKTADYIRGSDYEALAGAGAMLWAREARRDTDLFRATRFLDADGTDLTNLVYWRFGTERVQASRGRGTVVFYRPTAAGGAGTIWRGTRVRLSGGAFTEPRYYRVTVNTPVLADAVWQVVPIEALVSGPGSATDGSAAFHTLEDPLWDATWTVSQLVCADGTELEPPGVLRDRIRRERTDGRTGHVAAIIAACKSAGAVQVQGFRSDFGGDDVDHGLNVVYVGDLSYAGSASLVRACTAALRSVRVGGDHMQVLPMQRGDLTVSADVYLYTSPALLPVERIENIQRASLLQYLGDGDGAFTHARSGMFGALVRHTPEVQNVTFTSPTTDAEILTDGNFPEVLTRYYVSDTSITLRYHGP